MERVEAKELLKEHGLRATPTRIALLVALGEMDRPIAHAEVVKLMGEGEWDPATVFRNLVKLSDEGVLAKVHAGGTDRYALSNDHSDHKHLHFECNECGRVECLPDELEAHISVEGTWAASVENAALHLYGECPDCINS